MADITDTSPPRSFVVGDRVQYYISYFGESPKWYYAATVIAVNPQTNNNANETYDIQSNFSVDAKSVRPFRGGELHVGEICEFIQKKDEDGDPTETIPYCITTKYNDGSFFLSFLQRGMQAEHLQKLPSELNPFISFVVAINPMSMICLECISVIVCTDNVISHDETGDGPKSPFALITPSGCNALVGQRLYGNDSSMILSEQGWQFFQRVSGMILLARLLTFDS